jgi:hypothetical protein
MHLGFFAVIERAQVHGTFNIYFHATFPITVTFLTACSQPNTSEERCERLRENKYEMLRGVLRPLTTADYPKFISCPLFTGKKTFSTGQTLVYSNLGFLKEF